MMVKTPPTKIYLFKVALTNNKPVWRRIAVRGNQTLDDLHAAIFRAFDRFDEHLYSFYFPLPGARGRYRLQGAAEYTHPYNCEADYVGERFDRSQLRNAATTPIATLGLKKGQVFDYLFDFGDSWEHTITVEETDGAPQRGKYPRIVEKHRDSPPQYPDLDDDDDEEWEDEE